MSDVLYTVETRLSTAGTFASGLGDVGVKASSLDASIKSIGDGISGAASKMGSVLEGVVDKVASIAVGLTKIGGAAVIGAATYGVVGLNQELENTKISLSAIFQAQGFAKSWGASFGLAGDQLAKMKQDVKTLPGDLGQLSDIMKMIATPAAQGGAGPDAIRKLAGRTMLVGTILGVQQDVAAREMAGLLSGRAGSHNILGGRLGLIGDRAQAFNKEGAAARIADISKLFDQYSGAESAFSKSFIANWTTLKDNIKYGFLADATAPLFERVKGSIIDLNAYFDEHKDKVAAIANTVGHELENAWIRIEGIVVRVAGWVGKVGERVQEMKPGELLGDVKRVGEGMLAAKLGAGFLQSGLLGGILSGGASMLEGGGAAAAGGAGVLGGAVAVVGVADLAAAAAALHVLSDSASDLHPVAMSLADDIRVRLSDSFQRLSTDAQPLESAFVKLADVVGTGFLGAIDLGVRSISSYITAFDALSDKLSDWTAKAREKLGIPKLRDDVVQAISVDHQLGEVFRGITLNGRASKEADKGDPRGREGHGGMTIQRVEITVAAGNQDPSQIARVVEARLASLTRHPRASRHVPNYSASR